MFGHIVKALQFTAGYVAGVTGASYAIDAAAKVAAKTPIAGHVAPVLAGADKLITVADPFNWTGHQERSKSRRRIAGDADAPAPSGKLASILSKVEDAAKAAETKAVNTFEGLKANHAQRWAETARTVADRARLLEAENQERALELAQTALELAQRASNPPSSALDVLPEETTDAGRALATSVVDMVNRQTEEFSADAVADRIVNPAPFLEEQAVISGACCAACKYGTGSCAAPSAVPEEFMSGGINGEGLDDDGASFLSLMNPNGLDATGDDAGSMLETMNLDFADDDSFADLPDFGEVAGPPREFTVLAGVLDDAFKG